MFELPPPFRPVFIVRVTGILKKFSRFCWTLVRWNPVSPHRKLLGKERSGWGKPAGETDNGMEKQNNPFRRWIFYSKKMCFFLAFAVLVFLGVTVEIGSFIPLFIHNEHMLSYIPGFFFAGEIWTYHQHELGVFRPAIASFIVGYRIDGTNGTFIYLHHIQLIFMGSM